MKGRLAMAKLAEDGLWLFADFPPANNVRLASEAGQGGRPPAMVR
jgi:hypothetical protein